MNIWLRKKVPFYARHIRKKLFFRGNKLIKYYSVNIYGIMGVDNMTISKYHAYQPMVRMWFTGRFLEEECDYLNKCPNKRGYEGCMGGHLGRLWS